MTDRRGFQKERPKIEKWKQRDERKEAGRRQKGGYERASGNIQTLNRRATHGPKMEGIYPSTTYCGNANKLRTRE
jgi:hypothetical protein